MGRRKKIKHGPEKAGFSRGDHDAGKGGRQQDKRKTEYEMDWDPKGSHRLESASSEQGS